MQEEDDICIHELLSLRLKMQEERPKKKNRTHFTASQRTQAQQCAGEGRTDVPMLTDSRNMLQQIGSRGIRCLSKLKPAELAGACDSAPTAARQ